MSKAQSTEQEKQSFEKLKNDVISFDPVKWIEKFLTIDGNPFTLTSKGYKPLADIYRYVGVKALEPNAKPLVILKGRQTGATTMASALEMYFMGSGLFGTNGKPPIRVIHAFPLLELAAVYSKTKLQEMINKSVFIETDEKKSGKRKSHMQSLLDTSSPTNDSLSFKQFINNNYLMIESVGLNGDRLMGRQLCLETDIPTPTGFIKLKDLKEGDKLFDERGNICSITKLHPINISPEAYKITFDDGSEVDACAEHLWLTHTKQDRIAARRFREGKSKYVKVPTVKTTKEILNTLKAGGIKNPESNHSIPNTLPLNYPEKKLLIDPYLFGLWLGDGNQSGLIENADHEIFDNYDASPTPSSMERINPNNKFLNYRASKSYAYRIKGLTTNLGKLNQLQNTHNKIGDFYNKHIPKDYMQGSFEQRLALLQGLMDADGSCDKLGHCEFSQVREQLSLQVFELILSLGIKASLYKRESFRYDVRYQDKFRIRFRTDLQIFRLSRKFSRLQGNTVKTSHRFIKTIESIPSKPMRCITVDSPSHLFLITKHCIPTHNTADVIFYDEVQSTSEHAISNSLKVLTTSKYGNKGAQVFFGTPRGKGTAFQKRWQASTQQYYHLGCKECKNYFPLYTPGSDDWEKVWLYGYIVKCTHCGHEQDKRDAADRGKWFALKDENDDDVKLVGFHINQLYIPFFKKEDILNEKPGIHPTNNERAYQNEVLGEFFQGDSSPISIEDIRENCADVGRKMTASLDPSSNEIVVIGIDYGLRRDLEQMANPDKKAAGQSYSTAVVLRAQGAGLLSIEFATKFKKNDTESKKGLIEQLMRNYNAKVVVADIGFSQDFSEMMHTSHGDRYLVSRAAGKITSHIKYDKTAFPKEIQFEKSYYIGEMFDQMKKGMVRFPFGDFEKLGWLVDHCASMDIKPSISRTGDPSIQYVKGSGPNDGLMSLINAYLGYKFIVTQEFTKNNGQISNTAIKDLNKPLVLGGYVSRKI